MTQAADNNPNTPTRSDRVREALMRFESCTSRPSTVLALGDEQLFEVGLLVSDPALSISDAWAQTNERIVEDGGDTVSRSAFYRFADRFKALLGQVTAEHARRKIRLTVDDATDGRIASLNRLSRHRFAELVAEKLVDTDSIEEIDGYVAKLAVLLADAERARQADQRLELDQLNYERRLSETRAKLDLAEQRIAAMQLDAERKQTRIDERLNELQKWLDGLKRLAVAGQTITEVELEYADADLAAVREEIQGVSA